MKQQNMTERGDTIIVGVSGGADSVCLLSVLVSLREQFQWNLICAHVNHMFRDTAVRDEAYVKELCQKWSVPCEIKRVDVEGLAKVEKLTFEEAGRKVRYAFFTELKEKYQATKIAIAHNREDSAETMLFHLFRGSRLRGLGGIRPVSGDIIRPLLHTSRVQIEAYLNAKEILWQTDETNASTDYARNHLRHIILKEAEKRYPGATARVADTANYLQQVENYVREQVEEKFSFYCRIKDSADDETTDCSTGKGQGETEEIIIRNELRDESDFFVSQMLYAALERCAGSTKDLTAAHVEDLCRLFQLQVGRRICLPYQIVAYRTAEGIALRNETKKRNAEARNGVSLEGFLKEVERLSAKDTFCGNEDSADRPECYIGDLGMLTFRIFSYDKSQIIPQKTYTKWFDYDKITRCPVLRKRQTGDYLTISEEGHHKTLKEYFIQEKIPSYERDSIWVLAEESHIMWVVGHRISAFYKVTDNTKRVLEICIGGREDE